MGVRTRVIVVLTLVVIFIAAVTYAVGSSIASEAIETREALEVESTLDRVDAAVRAETTQLARTAKDWATWDDTYAFMADHNEAYVQSNLTGTALSALNVDFMLLIDDSGKPVAAMQAGKSGHDVGSLDGDMRDYLVGNQGLMSAVRYGDSVSGLVAPRGKPALVAVAPVLPTGGTGVVRGTFVVGRFLTQSLNGSISTVVGENVQIGSTAQSLMTAGWHKPGAKVAFLTRHDDAIIQGRRTLPGIDGTAAATVTITQKRTTRLLVQESARLVIAIVVIAVTLLLGALVFVIDHTVLHRLTRLGAEVKAIAARRSTDVRVHADGPDDEIAAVATGVNEMLAALHEFQTEVRYLAEHDVLTGLANRRRFEQELDRQLSAFRRFGRGFAVLWFDLDRFKDINDSFGHAAGDQILALLAETLRRESREYTSIARIGGDEFAILVPEADEREAMNTARRLIDRIDKAEYEIAGNRLRTSVSVGVALCPTDATSADGLLACADLAMYRAKSAGGNRAYRHSAESDCQVNERVMWAKRVSTALREDHFTLLGMPTMNLRTGDPGGYELLLRMIDDSGRLISPAAFIAAAESTALIDEIDEWVVRSALGLIGYEQVQRRANRFTVNISADGLNNTELVELVRGAHDRGTDVSRLMFEVTETAAVADLEAATQFANSVRRFGCSFALDDFGTGSASFHYLKHLPVDLLKIDGGLIQSLDRPEGDQCFVNAIVEMCRGLGITTVAEHVENDVTLAHVRATGIDYAQGFAVSQPQPLETFGIGPKAHPEVSARPFEFAGAITRLADNV